MPKTRSKRKNNPHVVVSKPYAELRRRVKEEYGLPSMTAADSFIATFYLERERERGSMSRLLQSKPEPEQMFKDLKKFLGGLQ